MCVDYKVHVNDKFITEAYHLPCVETIFAKLSGAKFSARTDLSNAYRQITHDEKSQEVFTVKSSIHK